MMFRVVYRYLFVAIIILMIGCDKPVVIDYKPSDSTLVSIASLMEQASTTPNIIIGDVYIEGIVLSSDDNWNIRGSIYITDRTATVEVRVEEGDLYKLFPCGSKIRISCNSLHMYIYSGMMRIGLDRENFWVTSIPKDKIPVYIESIPAPLEIITLDKTIGQLDSKTLGYYIQISDVQFEENESICSWVENNEVTKRVIIDKFGDSLSVKTLPTASFAQYRLPSGSGEIGGILIFEDDKYQLIITNYRDVAMNNPRF